MSRRIALTHAIEERYATPVRLSTHWLRLRPASHGHARVTAYALRIDTEPHFVNWVRDAFENYVARVDFPEPIARLAIEVGLIAEIDDVDPFDFLLDPAAVDYPFAYEPQLRHELGPYLRFDAPGPRVTRWLAALPRGRAGVADHLRAVMTAVYTSVAVAPPAGGDPLDVEAALARRAGPPPALAWLLVLGLRALGLGARYVSGYRITSDGAAVHAWCEVHLPGAGWIGLDPTASLFTDASYIPLACAPDPLRTRPLTGFHEACAHEASERVAATALVPSSSAEPYGDAAWAQITAVGRAIDAGLAAAGVELGVARELVFVSREHAGLAEWRTASLGATKRAAADALARAFRARLAPGAVVQAGTGEWFAGEPLPRWQLTCAWRADARPVWREAVPEGAPAVTPAGAEPFGRTLARALGVPAVSLVAAYEDPLGRVGRDASPEASAEDLRDPERRRALVDRISEEGAGEPVGFVLPLAWDHAADRWRSGSWTFRRRRLYLLDGTLPMGVRLPLASLPGRADAELDDPPRCPFAPRDALADYHALAVAALGAVPPPSPDAPAPRTAVCVEVRDGRLTVFLPPLGRIEQHLALVAAIDVAAEREGVAVCVEGYAPPEDPRLHRIVIEPDAGALRVTLPSSDGASAHLAVLEAASEEAARLGLVSERITTDGTRDALAVAAPIVLGGPTPDRSPFLRRPEILRALVVQWQRHPSLSYLFTVSVGPGGPAPRVDEGRPDALVELAIALERIPSGEAYPPWLPDRVLRHVLADATGDGRRAELSIERLYDPARASGRLGELALRSLGAAPCGRTAAVQALLVTALVARVAATPGAEALAPWAGALHDRFLLPSVLWADLRAVLADLEAAGYPLQDAWFVPFRERLFPRLGAVQLGDVGLELRVAHEPWPVLAEEATGGGMARFVDSATARIEVRVTGTSPRHVLVCNGGRVPLHPVGDGDARAGGVRYKHSCPPATLHPTIGAVGELVFNVVDAWTGMAIGGCRFAPSPPDLAGPIAVAPRAGEPAGGPDPFLAPAIIGPGGARRGAGRFRPYGSGLVPMAPPSDRAGPSWTLDLTGPA